jgi:hypothetical protein
MAMTMTDFEEKNVIGCLKTKISLIFLCFKKKQQLIDEFFLNRERVWM